MAKMVETDASVRDFIETIEKESKKTDSSKLLKMFEETTGFEPKIWGRSDNRIWKVALQVCIWL